MQQPLLEWGDEVVGALGMVGARVDGVGGDGLQEQVSAKHNDDPVGSTCVHLYPSQHLDRSLVQSFHSAMHVPGDLLGRDDTGAEVVGLLVGLGDTVGDLVPDGKIFTSAQFQNSRGWKGV